MDDKIGKDLDKGMTDKGMTDKGMTDKDENLNVMNSKDVDDESNIDDKFDKDIN